MGHYPTSVLLDGHIHVQASGLELSQECRINPESGPHPGYGSSFTMMVYAPGTRRPTATCTCSNQASTSGTGRRAPRSRCSRTATPARAPAPACAGALPSGVETLLMILGLHSTALSCLATRCQKRLPNRGRCMVGSRMQADTSFALARDLPSQSPVRCWAGIAGSSPGSGTAPRVAAPDADPGSGPPCGRSRCAFAAAELPVGIGDDSARSPPQVQLRS